MILTPPAAVRLRRHVLIFRGPEICDIDEVIWLDG